MKRLSFEQERKTVPDAVRSPASLFGRMKDAAMVGVALLGFSGCASAVAQSPPTVQRTEYRAVGSDSITPAFKPDSSLLYARTSHKDGVSPTASTVEIAGRTLEVVRLDTDLAILDRQTVQYREPETTSPSGMYQNSVLVPGVSRFLVSISPNENIRNLAFQYPTPNGTIARGIDLTEFNSLVRNVSGQEMARVNIVVERGTFNNNGVTTDYTNAYVFPQNAQGQVITRRGNGEYIVYVASFFNSSGTGGTSLIVEPGNRDTLYASR